jgi:hypothetical protein
MSESVAEFLARGGKIATVSASATGKKAPMTRAQAMRLYDAAQGYPRCGDEWPADAVEKQADKIVQNFLREQYEQ